jgi:hypothetical protein
MPTVQDEGVALTQRTVMDFVGSNVKATDDSANARTIVTITPSIGGSGTLTFTTGSAQSNVVTVTHNRGVTGYAISVIPTTAPPANATGLFLFVTSKTATTFQVQGTLNPKAALSLTFDWVLVGP